LAAAPEVTAHTAATGGSRFREIRRSQGHRSAWV